MLLIRLAPVAVAAAFLAAGCGAKGHLDATGLNAGNGKQLFQQKCAACHVLADAGSTGITGPNLDDAFGCAYAQGFQKSTVVDVVRGQIAYASPPMPRNLVTGADADDVAAYVAQVAGQGIDCSGSGTLSEPTPG